MTEVNQRYLKLARGVGDRLASMPESRFVLLIGSVADGTADAFSDIDLMVLFEPEPTEEVISRSLAKASVRKFWLSDHHFHVHYLLDGMPNAVLFTSAQRIEGFVEAYPDVSFAEYSKLSRYIVHGYPLHGDHDEVDSLAHSFN